MIEKIIFLFNTQETLGLGKRIAQVCTGGTIIYLYGELGSGKTTLSRGCLQALGYHGNVKSPTYTLVESYVLENIVVHHFDLYRISNPEEVEFLGIYDYSSKNAVWLVEWPQRCKEMLPEPDIVIHLQYCYEKQRKACISALSKAGSLFLRHFK